ncbi:MAG TPA: type II toxin-antitoxin system VapC family toxin [Ilumatobacter sp.]|nr:type II toxin-antitoxin system VapC family toxin [Ilumatobacter sp.]
MTPGALLLDTHSFAWSVGKLGRLSAAAREAIEDSESVVMVSAASVWELAIKHQSGKWPGVEPIVQDLQSSLAEIGALLWPVNGTHAVRAGMLAWAHTDPFDRMLAAVALTDKLTFVTKDREFGDVSGLNVLW